MSYSSSCKIENTPSIDHASHQHFNASEVSVLSDSAGQHLKALVCILSNRWQDDAVWIVSWPYWCFIFIKHMFQLLFSFVSPHSCWESFPIKPRSKGSRGTDIINTFVRRRGHLSIPRCKTMLLGSYPPKSFYSNGETAK